MNPMKCKQCGTRMVKVGRSFAPGHSEIWVDGSVCPEPNCMGHGTLGYDGDAVYWPALTLGDAPVHANIRGAIEFKKALWVTARII